MLKTFILALALLTAACATPAQQGPSSETAPARSIQSLPVDQPAADSAAAAVDAFSAALRAADPAAVERLMAPDVLIAESGGVERSYAEYAEHHLPADIAFISAVQFTLERRDLIDSGDLATVISQSRVEGAFHDRAIRSRSMETMVLRRVNGAWRIQHIHWSSAPISEAHAQ